MKILKDEVLMADVERLFQKNIFEVLRCMLNQEPTSEHYAKLLDIESQLVRDFFHYESMLQPDPMFPSALINSDNEEVEKNEN